MSDDIVRLGFEIDATALGKAKAAADDVASSTKKLGDELDKLGQKSQNQNNNTGGLVQTLARFANMANTAGGGIRRLQGEVGSLAAAFGIATGSGTGVALAGALRAANLGIEGLAGLMGRFGPVAAGITSGVGSMGTAFIGLQAALANVQDKFTQAEARMRQAIGSAELARKAFDDLRKSSMESGIAFDAASGSFIRLARNKDQLGATTEQILVLTETIQKLGVVSGAGQGEMASGMLQLSQALASGRLNGDELRSILENMPALAKAIADGLGVGVGQLRAMGAAGELTGEKVFKAILSQTEKVRRDFKDLPDTTERAFTRMKDSAEGFVNELAKIMNSSSMTQSIINWFTDGFRAAEKQLKGMTPAERVAAAQEYARGVKNTTVYGPAMRADASRQVGTQAYQSYLEGRSADRVAMNERENVLNADITRGMGVVQNVDEYAKKLKESTEQIKVTEAAIARVNVRLKEPGADVKTLNNQLDALSKGLVVLKQGALDDALAFDKFTRSLSNLRQQIGIGGGGGGLQIVEQAQQLVEQGARQGRPTSLSNAIGAVTTDRATRSMLDVQNLKQQADAQRGLIATVGQSVAVMREAELAQAALDYRWKNFGTITGPLVDKAVAAYVEGLRDLKSASDQLANSTAFQKITDSISVINAQAGAVGQGAYAMRRAQMLAEAALEERTTPGITGRRVSAFDAQERLNTAQMLSEMGRNTQGTIERGNLAGNVVGLQEWALQRRIQDAQRGAAPGEAAGIETAIRAEDEAQRTAQLQEQTAALRQQLEYAKDQARLTRLWDEDLAVQTALMERQRALQQQGVEVGSIYYQQQMQLTEELAKQNYAMAKHQEQVGEIKRVWELAAKGIQEGMASAFETAFSRGENRGRQMLNALGDISKRIVSQMMSAMVFTPASNALSGALNTFVRGMMPAAPIGAINSGGLDGSMGDAGNVVAKLLGMGSANGNAFTGGHIIPFARGGVVTRPVLFPMANGMGLMGEAGPEAVMPLKRGADGRLGVTAGGNAGVVVQVFDQRSSGQNEPIQINDRRDSNGNRVLQIMVRDQVRSAIRAGEFDGDMRAMYGTTRLLAKR